MIPAYKELFATPDTLQKTENKKKYSQKKPDVKLFGKGFKLGSCPKDKVLYSSSSI